MAAGLPGDRTGVALLYFAMFGLVVDSLTMPAIVEGYDTDALIQELVEHVLDS